MKSRYILPAGLLLVLSAQAEQPLDAEFLEFLGALESEESWEEFFDSLPKTAGGETAGPVVARPEAEELDDDAG